MDRESQYDLSSLSSEQLDELEEDMQDAKEDEQQDQLELSSEMQELYGSPMPEEKHNAHTFLNKAAFESPDTIRTTFLSESELGRPLFSVRFLSDLHDISKYYLDPILEGLGKDPKTFNGIANYFWEKIQNVTHSGMSNKGFAMNLNVTQRRDMTRKRIKVPTIEKEGKK